MGKLKIEAPCDLAILLLGIYPKARTSGSPRDPCTPTCIAALFTIARPRRQAESVNRKRIKKTQNTGILFSLKKKKETLSYVTMWTNLEDVVLSERSQPHKDKYSVVPRAGGTENSQIQSQKNKGEWLPGAGWGNGEMLVNGRKVSRQKNKF